MDKLLLLGKMSLPGIVKLGRRRSRPYRFEFELSLEDYRSWDDTQVAICVCIEFDLLPEVLLSSGKSLPSLMERMNPRFNAARSLT